MPYSWPDEAFPRMGGILASFPCWAFLTRGRLPVDPKTGVCARLVCWDGSERQHPSQPPVPLEAVRAVPGQNEADHGRSVRSAVPVGSSGDAVEQFLCGDYLPLCLGGKVLTTLDDEWRDKPGLT